MAKSNPKHRYGSKAKYRHYRKKAPGKFAKESFRVVDPGRPGHTKLVIGCPKGQYSRKTKRCRVGTEVQKVMRAKNPGRKFKTPNVVDIREYKGGLVTWKIIQTSPHRFTIVQDDKSKFGMGYRNQILGAFSTQSKADAYLNKYIRDLRLPNPRKKTMRKKNPAKWQHKYFVEMSGREVFSTTSKTAAHKKVKQIRKSYGLGVPVHITKIPMKVESNPAYGERGTRGIRGYESTTTPPKHIIDWEYVGKTKTKDEMGINRLLAPFRTQPLAHLKVEKKKGYFHVYRGKVRR